MGDQDLPLDLLDGTQTTCVLVVTILRIVPEQDLHAQPPISVLELGLYVYDCVYCITFFSNERDGHSTLVRLIWANFDAVSRPFLCSSQRLDCAWSLVEYSR